ncbi:putative PPE family protein PPE32 [Mycobacterium heckeshornense]|uniref:PPE family protein n=1 Tax=Mycobacterium heckeshornense TaxID=110505 RepID=UPI0019414041|nr:PPE family protein [Mycobacterium heckeshornense]BCQ10620.1 putative PPE family protein PPE32 [Mycobacterium heckeshornense]
MEFWALPPEINSARIYSGPGSGPLLTAATAWDELAATLHTTARAWQSVISGLTSGFWHGPASMSMATAGAHYISWLVSTCTHAEQAAARARAAAAAYEAARATIVPPPVIAANRSLLALLVATNVLGQNGPAIAATEAHYGQMWAQDVAVMYAYAAASAAASTLTPFTAPPAVTDPAGLARQSLAVAQAAGAAGAARTSAALSTAARVLSAVPQALQELGSPGSGSSLLTALNTLNDHATAVSGHARTTFSALSFVTGAANLAKTVNVAGPASGAGIAAAGSGAAGMGFAGPAGLGTAGGAAVSAGMSRAVSVGSLSVPQSWATAANGVGPVSAALPSSGTAALPVHGIAGVPAVPVAGMTARSAGRLADASRFLLRPSMLPRWPAGG